MRITRPWIMMSVALIAGLMAVLLASRWLDAKSGSGMTKVAVVSTDISLGQRLTPELVQLDISWASLIKKGQVKYNLPFSQYNKNTNGKQFLVSRAYSNTCEVIERY